MVPNASILVNRQDSEINLLLVSHQTGVYFPKGTEMSRYSTNEINAVALALDTRPRKLLDGRHQQRHSTSTYAKPNKSVLRRPLEVGLRPRGGLARENRETGQDAELARKYHWTELRMEWFHKELHKLIKRCNTDTQAMQFLESHHPKLNTACL